MKAKKNKKEKQMFKKLTEQITDLTKRVTSYGDDLENELSKLHDKRDKRYEELSSLQTTLPYLSKIYEGLVKSFGYSENDIKKDDAVKAKKDIKIALRKYKEVKYSLKEIENSIIALEKALTEDVDIEDTETAETDVREIA